ncbi:MAG: response regulator, partial [Opitutales bacterium]|nr:response regulator [Opitutales bacterium]
MPDSILIVDDEKHTRDGLKAALSIDYDVAGAANVEEAKRLLQAEKFDLVLTDLRMGTQSGMNLLEYIKNSRPKCLCIMMTAYGTIASAVEAMRKGACDFITKPIDLDTLDAIIKKALAQRKKEETPLPQQNTQSAQPTQQKRQTQPQTPDEKFKIISQSPVFEEVLLEAKKAAASKATILLTGETGTGKELVA